LEFTLLYPYRFPAILFFPPFGVFSLHASPFAPLPAEPIVFFCLFFIPDDFARSLFPFSPLPSFPPFFFGAQLSRLNSHVLLPPPSTMPPPLPLPFLYQFSTPPPGSALTLFDKHPRFPHQFLFSTLFIFSPPPWTPPHYPTLFSPPPTKTDLRDSYFFL